MTPEELKKDWEVIENISGESWFINQYGEIENLRMECEGCSGNTTLVFREDADFIVRARIRWPEALREIQVLMGRCELMKKTLEQIKDLKEPDSTFLVTGIACIGLAVDSVFKKECQ